MDADRVLFRQHAVERMFERGIGRDEVFTVLETGETIEQYPDDEPFQSALLLGFIDERPLHVVAASDGVTTFVITTYRPDPERWTEDFRERLH